jgi:ATP-dependent Clp protease adapter protein ClpS
METINKKYDLYILNDGITSFGDVMHALIKHCEHNPYQAEQCALIAHNTGKCSVKSSINMTELIDIQIAFDNLKLRSTID